MCGYDNILGLSCKAPRNYTDSNAKIVVHYLSYLLSWFVLFVTCPL